MGKSSEADFFLWHSIHLPHQLWKQRIKGKTKIHSVIVTMLLLGACSASFFIFTTMILNNTRLFVLSQAIARGNVSCDFSHFCTSVCDLRGDVRVSASSSTVALFSTNQTTHAIGKIRPYTRKWERMMKTIGEVSLISFPSSSRSQMACDVRHPVPAVIFSTGGYTGNAFHDFNNGLVPLYITSERFRGEVIFMIQEFQPWWPSKYSEILKQLTHYPVINLNQTQQVHCFPQVIVGLKFHGDMIIDSSAMPDGKSMRDFQKLLGVAFDPEQKISPKDKPTLVILNRESTRVIVNLNETVELAQTLGYEVQVFAPVFNTRLSTIYPLLHSADVFMGVHGAGLAHFLFMRPNSTLIQIVPFGLDTPAASCYGKPAAGAGLEYIEYKIEASESTLSESFGVNHTVIVNPKEILEKGWTERKKIYLDKQNVRLSLPRIQRVLGNVLEKLQHQRGI